MREGKEVQSLFCKFKPKVEKLEKAYSKILPVPSPASL